MFFVVSCRVVFMYGFSYFQSVSCIYILLDLLNPFNIFFCWSCSEIGMVFIVPLFLLKSFICTDQFKWWQKAQLNSFPSTVRSTIHLIFMPISIKAHTTALFKYHTRKAQEINISLNMSSHNRPLHQFKTKSYIDHNILHSYSYISSHTYSYQLILIRQLRTKYVLQPSVHHGISTTNQLASHNT